MAGRKFDKCRSRVHHSTIAVAVSEEEKEKILKEANALGLSMSAYIRYRLFIKEVK